MKILIFWFKFHWSFVPAGLIDNLSVLLQIMAWCHQAARSIVPRALTHLPLDKMAAILANNTFSCILLNENDRILIQISLNYVPRSPIDNNPELV